MKDKLTLIEKKAPVLKTVLTGSFFIVVIFVLLFLLTEAPLWSGIFQLFAFTGFAILVLVYLQWRGKEYQIELEFSNKELVVNYYHESTKIQEEFFKLDPIQQITDIENPTIWGILPAKGCATMKITFTDNPNNLSLFRIEGRDLMISSGDAEKTERFLTERLSKRSK